MSANPSHDTRGNSSRSTEVQAPKLVDSVMQLIALGLSVEEIESLDISRPTLQAILEYVERQKTCRTRITSGDAAHHTAETLSAVEDELKSLEMEMEMLSLRKRSLLKRSKVLNKVLSILKSRERDVAA